MCKVSVIVPVDNTEKYLPACLESFTVQTLDDIGIIVENDGNDVALCWGGRKGNHIWA